MINPRLKHRLVGAAVLVALAVLILPDLLDGEKVKRQQSFAVIPLQKELVGATFETPPAPEKLAIEPAKLAPLENSEPSGSESSTRSESSTDKEQNDSHPDNPEDRKLAQFKESAYVLQLGVFRNATNVNDLIQKMRKAGYPAFSKPKKPVQGEPTWVYVGPELNKSKLLTFKPELKSLTGLNGKVYPYNPQSQ